MNNTEMIEISGEIETVKSEKSWSKDDRQTG
jgi:hypothetical protein